MKYSLIFGGLICVCTAAFLALRILPGPYVLNLINRVTPGDTGVGVIAKDIEYGSDPRQKLDIYRSSAVQKDAQPVLIFFYGGSWNSGRRQDYQFAAEAYAAKGYLVVVPDYRLVPQVTFPDFVMDSANAVRWVKNNIARFGGDPDRIALAGHSAGAYIAIMLALDPKYLRNSGVDIKAVVGLAGPYDFYPFTNADAIAAFANNPDPRQTQPIHFVRSDAPPLWLASGSNDILVKPRNSKALAKAQNAIGGRAIYHEYPGLSHEDIIMALSRTFRTKAPVLQDSTAFLEQIMHPAP